MISAWNETIRTALEALNARRMRSTLTVLGILIGISAVMLTVGLGQGAQAEVANQINSLGSNMLIVSPGGSTTQMSGGFRMRRTVSTLTRQDAELLADSSVVPSVSAVSPVSSTSGQLQSDQATWTSTIAGTTPQWLQVRAREIESGRFFTAEEVQQGASVAVIGPDTASELFSYSSPVGQSVMANGQSFTIIGVLKSLGSSLSMSEDDTFVVPYTTFTARFLTSGNANSVDTIYLQATDTDSLSAAYQEVNNALLTSHGITSDSADFSLSTQAALVDAMSSITGVLTLVLGAIAAISLLVGGIGVMNIMLVSVSERVREIGLRKALGATPATIRRQFLVEAAALGMAGGASGIGLGYLGAWLISNAISMAITISLPVALLALGVSLAIGLAAGVYPASRAAKLAPIDALRSE